MAAHPNHLDRLRNDARPKNAPRLRLSHDKAFRIVFVALPKAYANARCIYCGSEQIRGVIVITEDGTPLIPGTDEMDPNVCAIFAKNAWTDGGEQRHE